MRTWVKFVHLTPKKMKKVHFPIQKWCLKSKIFEFRSKYHLKSALSTSIHLIEVVNGQIAQNIMKIGLGGL